MTSKPEGPGKDQGRPADGGAPKRPHATIDLKATEVKTEPVKTEPAASEPAKSEPAKPEPSKSEPAKSSSMPSQKPAGAAAAPATGAAADDVKTAPKATPGAKASEPAKASMPPPAASAKRGGSGILGMLGAGLVGAAAALAGSQWLPPDLLPKPRSDQSEAARKLEARLAALESQAGKPATDNAVTARLDETTERIAKLEALNAAIEKLTGGQEKLAAETRNLAGKVGQPEQAEAAQQRLTKLEDQLSTIAAAASEGGDKGRIAGIAAVTGRIADLESRLDTQVGALRKSIPEEIATRIGTVAEASEAARSSAQRLDRDMQTVKTDVVRLGQRTEELKADGDRLAQTLEVLRQDQGKQTSVVDGLKTTLEAEIKRLAKPADVTAAVAPVATKLAELEKSLEGVVRSEGERKSDAERIVVSLELANLKRALDNGAGFAAELAAVRKASGGKIDLSALDRFQNGGLPTLAELERDFRPLAHQIIDAEADPAGAGVMDRLLAGAKSVVRVRKVSHSPDDKSAEAVVSRIEAALKEGRLAEALEHARQIPPAAAPRAADWMAKAEARHTVDRAIGTIEQQLKASLSGSAPPAAAPANPSN